MTLRGGADSKQYRHNQQLEELRNLQDKLSGEKAAWNALKEQETKDLEEKKAELLRLQVKIIYSNILLGVLHIIKDCYSIDLKSSRKNEKYRAEHTGCCDIRPTIL